MPSNLQLLEQVLLLMTLRSSFQCGQMRRAPLTDSQSIIIANIVKRKLEYNERAHTKIESAAYCMMYTVHVQCRYNNCRTSNEILGPTQKISALLNMYILWFSSSLKGQCKFTFAHAQYEVTVTSQYLY